MTQKELLIPIFLKDGKAVKDWKDFSLFLEGDPKSLAQYYDNHGAEYAGRETTDAFIAGH